MLFTNFYVHISIITYFYLTIYNVTLIGFFWSIVTLINLKLKTLYSFSIFGFDSFYIFFLTLFLFSLAGVPPFMGFFSKLYLLNIISLNKIYLLNSLFFIILMFSLYFYVQNLRFLHSTNLYKSIKPFLKNERIIILFYYYLIFTAYVLVNGFFVGEYFIEYFHWLQL